jgi:catechol 2,3-dioxygenase-like lactoylglutathione lyase family enzyme
MAVLGFDHVSIPTSNVERLLDFYRRLGFAIEGEAEWRAGTHPVVSIAFGDSKINVHPETMVAMRGQAWYLRAPSAEPGCGDLCFVWDGGVDALLETFSTAGVEVISGPVAKTGGRRAGAGRGVSAYVRDPDQNLLEFISYAPDDIERLPPTRRT